MKNFARFFENKFFSPPEKLRLILVALVAGILAKNFWSPNFFLIFAATFFFAALFFRQFFFGIFAAFFFAGFFGIWRENFFFKNEILPNFFNQKIAISGEICSFIDAREKNNRANFCAKKIFANEKILKIDEKILIIFEKNFLPKYGQKLKISGKIQQPRNFGNFNYREFLRKFGISTILFAKKISILDENLGGNFFLKSALRARNFLQQNLEKILPPPHSTIAMGILLGVKNELPENTKKKFRDSGLLHLLVVSGSNISIVIIFISIFLKFLGRRVVFWCSILAVGFFVAMTGADGPVLRAAVMGGIAGFGIATGRPAGAKNLILLSAAILAAINPQILRADFGFLLSIFATAGIIFFTPILEKIFYFLPQKFGMRQIFCVSAAAEIAVFPLLGLLSSEFAIIGAIANIFAEPLVAFAMLFSFVVALTGIFPIFFAKIFTVPALVILNFLLAIAHFFAQFPPLKIPEKIATFFIFLHCCFFFYATFSRNFSRRFLQKSRDFGDG